MQGPAAAQLVRRLGQHACFPVEFSGLIREQACLGFELHSAVLGQCLRRRDPWARIRYGTSGPAKCAQARLGLGHLLRQCLGIGQAVAQAVVIANRSIGSLEVRDLGVDLVQVSTQAREFRERAAKGGRIAALCGGPAGRGNEHQDQEGRADKFGDTPHSGPIIARPAPTGLSPETAWLASKYLSFLMPRRYGLSPAPASLAWRLCKLGLLLST